MKNQLTTKRKLGITALSTFAVLIVGVLFEFKESPLSEYERILLFLLTHCSLSHLLD